MEVYGRPIAAHVGTSSPPSLYTLEHLRETLNATPSPPLPPYFLASSCSAKPITFLWVFTFPLSVYAPLVIPSLLAFIITTVETIGDVTTTAEVSKLEVEGPAHFQVQRSTMQLSRQYWNALRHAE